MWNVINNLIRKSNDKSQITELQVNGMKLNKENDICNAFNEHFAKAGQRVRDTIPDGKPKKSPLSYLKRISNCLLFSPVSELTICEIVMSLKSKTSYGYEYISNALLTQLVSVIQLPITIIFNKSLSCGEFPDLMKIAKVIPLYKGGLRDIPDNYRPISLLPVISKVLEHILYNSLVKHLQLNGILYP